MQNSKPEYAVIYTFIVGYQIMPYSTFINWAFNVKFTGTAEQCVDYIKSKLPQA